MMGNWYRRSAVEQGDFGFMGDESTKVPSPALYHSKKSPETLQALLDESTGYLAVESGLIKYGYKWKLVRFPSGGRVVVVDIGTDKYVVDDFIHPGAREAREWLWRLAASEMEGYYPGVVFNEDFWKWGTGRLWHGTTEEGAAGILAGGLEPRDETRGMGNSDTGPAVFMSDSLEETGYFYPVVLEINTSAMRADGFRPEMEQESPVGEAKLREAIAHSLGVEDFVAETEAGVFEGTVVCREKIPPKYIRRVK